VSARQLSFGSVCSGIEAASQAWLPLGWTCNFVSEIDPFPRAVLKHRHPSTPLHGDFTTIKAGDYATIDVLVGGTPCQSFSIAGLRKGMADERGNLALEYLRLVDRLRPRWVVWENVPGVLSSNSHDAPDPRSPPDDMEEGSEWVGEDEYDADESHAFSCFLAGLSELGYGFAYRVFDAQFFGLAQRRERVFVVGYLGDWRRAAAVLFEPASLRGNSPPRREKGKVAPIGTLGGTSPSGGWRFGADEAAAGQLIPQAFGGNNTSGPIEISTALNAHGGPMGRMDFESETFIAHILRGEGFDGSEDGTGRGTPIFPVAFSSKDHGADASHGLSPTLRAMGHAGSHPNGGGQVAIAFDWQKGDGGNDTSFKGKSRSWITRAGDYTGTLGATKRDAVAYASAVRRLTPRECERLQGFPDDYTLIPWRRGLAPDGPRYKALGNSMAVPVMAWIGRRIASANACL
jgi:DNA (cytosine-5)-methyltransferase 1